MPLMLQRPFFAFFIAAFALPALSSPPAAGAPASSGFYVGGEFQALRIDTGRPRAVGRDVAPSLPVTFASGASGFLTRDVVVAAQSGQLIAARAATAAQPGYVSAVTLPFGRGLLRATYESPLAALAAANALHGVGAVRYAHPDFAIQKQSRSAPADEPLFTRQWHLENRNDDQCVAGADIKARQAWGVTTGSPAVIVAVIDDSFQLKHPDMVGAWAVNAGETAGNGLDDDGNGYVDDVVGWNFDENNADLDGGDYAVHGIAVAGLVGARANGVGVTGVCPGCSILPIVTGMRPSEDAAGFYYAQRRGAAVITNSWGYPVGTPRFDVIKEAIDTVAAEGRGGKGTLILFAMNNEDVDDCSGANPDISSLDSVIAISASSCADRKVVDSGWGRCLKVLSPSQEDGLPGITTTDKIGDDGYNPSLADDLDDVDYTRTFNGTSAATPIAAGVFGLVLSVAPELTRAEALAVVTGSAAKIQADAAAYDVAGFSATYGYGRIDAYGAVRAALNRRRPAPPAPPAPPARR
jgi:subtilisin family serine protease